MHNQNSSGAVSEMHYLHCIMYGPTKERTEKKLNGKMGEKYSITDRQGPLENL